MKPWQKWQIYFRPDFGQLGPNLPPFPPSFFFQGFYRCYMLDITASYHRVKFQGQLMIQIQENVKKLICRPTGPKFGPPIFFSKTWLLQSLDIKVSYKNVQYQKKLIIQSWENLVTDGQTHRRTDGQTDRWMRVT